MSGWRFPRAPRWLSLVVSAMSGLLALDYLRVYLGDRSPARLVAMGFWVVNGLVWLWVYALNRRRGPGGPPR